MKNGKLHDKNLKSTFNFPETFQKLLGWEIWEHLGAVEFYRIIKV